MLYSDEDVSKVDSFSNSSLITFIAASGTVSALSLSWNLAIKFSYLHALSYNSRSIVDSALTLSSCSCPSSFLIAFNCSSNKYFLCRTCQYVIV